MVAAETSEALLVLNTTVFLCREFAQSGVPEMKRFATCIL